MSHVCLILVETIEFMTEEYNVSEETPEACVRVCANLPEMLTITRTVSVIVDVEPGEREPEGQLNRHTCSCHFTAFKQY